MVGNPLMNDASLSQTAGRAKTRQPGLLVKPTQIVLSSYILLYIRQDEVIVRSCYSVIGIEPILSKPPLAFLAGPTDPRPRASHTVAETIGTQFVITPCCGFSYFLKEFFCEFYILCAG
jgi:hypothetical protein